MNEGAKVFEVGVPVFESERCLDAEPPAGAKVVAIDAYD